MQIGISFKKFEATDDIPGAFELEHQEGKWSAVVGWMVAISVIEMEEYRYGRWSFGRSIHMVSDPSGWSSQCFLSWIS